MKSVCLLLTIFFIISCGENNRIHQELSAPTQKGDIDTFGNGQGTDQTYNGVDLNGNAKSCKPMNPSMNCSFVFTDSDAFGQECKNQGHLAIQCACHDWICVQQ